MILRSRILHGMRVVLPPLIFPLLIVISLIEPAVVEAQQSIAPGSVSLTATFEAMGVRARFSGDSNANAIATVKFRKSGELGWHDAYPPFIDRRVTIGGVVNPYAFEARGSIVGLTSNTAYEVQVTWADPDGVSGAQPSVATVTTLSYTPPTGGSTITVTNNATLAGALSSVNPGQTIHLNPGTYSPFTISRSGNASAWIVIEGDAGGGSIVTGSGVNQNIRVNANFLVLEHLTLSASDFNGIVTGSNNHDLLISGNTVQGFSRLCADGPGTTHSEDTGILVGSGASNAFVLNNSVTGSTNLIGCLQSPSYAGPGQGIALYNCTTCVVAGNTVVGNGTRDAITSDNSNNILTNVDIANNSISGYMDDGVEFKGQNLNARAWGNIITQDGNGTVGGNTCMSNETTLGTNDYGPSYYFRNTCKVIRTVGGCSYKGPSGPLFYFHNSLDATGASGSSGWSIGCGASSTSTGPYVMLNNASKITNSMTEHAPAATSTFDYNCGTTPGTYAYQWNNTTNYSTFAAFRSGTGQEAHGLNSDPLFADTTLHLASNSPAIDAGVVLPNFNSLDSAWPYSGSAPDIGAFESGGAVPGAPTDLQIK